VSRRWLVAVVAIAAALLSSCSSGGWTRAECSPAKPAPEIGLQPLQLQSGGIARDALVYVPKGYDGSKEYPVVFNWHGYGSDAATHMKDADMSNVADDEGFIIVAPDGTESPSRFNLEAGITSDADDVAFASDLIDRVSKDLCVDSTRIFSVGVSNGGGMSGLLACRDGASTFAAVAMVALELKPAGCASPSPSVLAIQGDADLVVPFQGGRVNCCGGWPIAPAQETMQQWADQLGCSGEDRSKVSEHVTKRTWHGCEDGRSVVFYRVHGGGHTWPGIEGKGPLGYTTGEIDAADVVWDFFEHYTTSAN
jgi:polyhydroxybutyrate depolymerase